MKKLSFVAALGCLLFSSCHAGVDFDQCKADDNVCLYVVESNLGTLTELTFYGTASGKSAEVGQCFSDEGLTYDYRVSSAADFADTMIKPQRITVDGEHKNFKIDGAYIIPDVKGNPTDTLFLDINDENTPLYTAAYHECPSKDMSHDDTYRHFSQIVSADHIIKCVFTIDEDYIASLRKK